MPGSKMSAYLIPSAVWLWRNWCHQRWTTNSGTMTDTTESGVDAWTWRAYLTSGRVTSRWGESTASSGTSSTAVAHSLTTRIVSSWSTLNVTARSSVGLSERAYSSARRVALCTADTRTIAIVLVGTTGRLDVTLFSSARTGTSETTTRRSNSKPAFSKSARRRRTNSRRPFVS